VTAAERGERVAGVRIEEVMTRDVVTVTPATSIQSAAKMMADHGISGLPVVDADRRLVGIISEGDLILRQRSRSPSKRPWWRRFFDDAEGLAREYRKVAGTTVAEVMTRPVVSINPVFGVETAASILHARGFRRLPVVRDGKLVGIISRGDLVRALATAVPATGARSDAELVEEMKTRLAAEPWTSTAGFVIHAKRGVIFLWGAVPTQTEKAALETMARAIEGCTGVENDLVARH
jgi:CBS domain-containing protein